MTYLRIEWIHGLDHEPIEMLSELDDLRKETRKVEQFRDGTLGFAGPGSSSGSTVLSESSLPTIEEIAADPQFHPVEIGKDAFEDCWKAATMSVAA